MALHRLARAVLAPLLLVSLAAAPLGAALEPGPGAAIVGQLVARILEQSHYARRPIDAETSRQFFRNYLESFDYNHMFFEKADVAEFESRFADSLGERLKQGDVFPAYEIFERLMKRLEEREALVRKLSNDAFDFSKDEAIAVDRHEAPWPDGQREASELWRARVKYEILQERLNKAKPEEQAKTVALRYERLLRMYREFDASDVLQVYLTALSHAFDPHSDYMAAPQKENFDISMRLSLVGIGAVLRSEDGYAKIVSLVPGGPADLDKRLKPNDRIEAVAQGNEPFVEAVGMKLDRLVQLIRGEKGTTVRLRVIPADALDPSTRVEIALVRQEIKLTDQEAKAKVLTVPGAEGRQARVGVIDLPSFYADMKSVVEPKSTTRDVERLLEELKRRGIDSLVLDLRRNGGGSLPESVALAGLFIPEGPVVQVKDARGLIKLLKDTEPGVSYEGPVLVLTSRASASASEIVAAALQDYARGVVVGEKSTFGKGTVQSIIELAQYLPAALRSYNPGAVKLTIQKFYRVSGGSTQHRGVIPDIRLPSLDDHMDSTEDALKNALPYDEVEPAGYPRMARVSPARLKELDAASARRVASSPEWAYVREDIEAYKRQKDLKTVSLNEAKRLEEKKADEERAQRRKAERLARKTAPLASVEITLQSLDGTAPAPAAPPAASTAAAPGSDYEKSPPPSDLVLEEAARIAAELAAAAPSSQHAVAVTTDTFTP